MIPALLLFVSSVASPDGNAVVSIHPTAESLQWSVEYKGAPVVRPSRIGLSLYSGAFDVLGSTTRTVDTRWTHRLGERRDVPDRYRELTVRLRDKAAPHRPLDLIVRAYDEGVALRYRIGGQGTFLYASDYTDFSFPEGSQAWEEHGTEGPYSRVPVQDIKSGCERPLTVELPSGKYASVLIADIDNYPRALLSPVRGKPGVLTSDLGGPVRGTAPFENAWHAILLADSPAQLIERNYLVLNLNPPSRLADTSWIRPGKVMREVTLSTAGGKAVVDFAARYGLQYVEYDAGWYGHEYDDVSDATRVSPDPARIRNIPNHGGLDLAEVIRYARSKDIGVILYVNRRALERQLDLLLPLYARWGVAGLKYGFVNVGPQDWAGWLHDAIRKTAAHRMIVDVHDSYRPGGFIRTYPNLLTQEGVRGNEHMPDAAHNATLPFTRALAGPMDYTICWTTNRLKTTRAHQLALAVVNYSPLQFLYWYDKPSDVADEPALEFFRHVPTVWDETRVLDAQIGQHVAIARRGGTDWYLGAITADAKTMSFPLTFLQPGKTYRAELYRNGAASTEVIRETRNVTASDRISADVPAAGGLSARFTEL